MRRVATILGTAAVVLMATSVYAQTPTFAGKWTVDAEKNAAMNPNAGGGRGGGRGGMGGGEITITQDAKVLTITRTTQAGEMKTTYNLDGTPSKNMTMGRGGQTEITSTAKWDGAKLVITSDNGQTIAYSMDGAWLVQATTAAGRGGGEPVTRSSYYKKAM